MLSIYLQQNNNNETLKKLFYRSEGSLHQLFTIGNIDMPVTNEPDILDDPDIVCDCADGSCTNVLDVTSLDWWILPPSAQKVASFYYAI